MQKIRSDFFDNVTSTPEEEDTDNLVDKKEPIETQEAKSEQQKLKDKIFDEIDNLKLKSNGNYDAILGKVTNFNFAFNGDGTYNCQFVIVLLASYLVTFNYLKLDSLKIRENKK